MFEFLAMLIWIALTGAAGIGGYLYVKRFVRRRLRFVDAARKPWVPLVAGLGAAALALPVVALLPILSGGTAALFGVGVGLGVAAARREWKKLPGA